MHEAADFSCGSTARMRVRALARQVYPRELTNVCGAANGRFVQILLQK
jgi:hypothetical protein